MKYYKNLKEEKERLNLKSEKVELALLNDIEADYKRLNKIMDNTESHVVPLKNTANKGVKDSVQGSELSKQILKDIKKLKDQAKELGVKVDVGGIEAGTDSMLKAFDDYVRYYNFIYKS